MVTLYIPCDLVHPADVSGDDGSAEELFAAEAAPEAPPAAAAAVPVALFGGAIYRRRVLGVVLLLEVSPGGPIQ